MAHQLSRKEGLLAVPREAVRVLTTALKPIRVRILGLAVASTLVAGATVYVAATAAIKDELRKSAFARIELLTDRASRTLSDWLQDQANRVRAMAGSQLVLDEVASLAREARNEGAPKARQNLERYFSYILDGNRAFQGFAVLSEDGRALMSVPQGLLGSLAGLAPALSEKDPVLVLGSRPSDQNLLVVKGVGSQQGKGRVAYLVAVLEPREVERQIAESTNEGSTSAAGPSPSAAVPDAARTVKTKAILVDDAHVVRFSPSEPGQVGAQAPEEYKAALEQEGVAVEVGGKFLCARKLRFEAQPEGILRVKTETASGEAFSAVSGIQQRILLLSLVLVAILLSIALVVAQTIASPLVALSQVASRIRSGEAGLTVTSRAGGEMGELVTAFNSMSTSLRKQVEEMTALNDRLREMSITDPLTGLFNRRYIIDQVQRALDIADRTGLPHSVVMVDLDHFKAYNDTYGHIAGDEALRQVSRTLRENLRRTDLVARHGGEEFLVWLENANREYAVGLAEILRVAVESMAMEVRGEATRMTASFGVATAPEDGRTYEELYEAADRALYEAKRLGRNRVQSFSGPSLSEATPPARMAASPEASRRSEPQRPPHPRSKGSRPSPQRGKGSPSE